MLSWHNIAHRVLLGVGVEHLGLLPVVQGVVNKRGQHHVIVEIRGVRVRVKIHGVQEHAESDHNDDDYNDHDTDYDSGNDHHLSAERPEMA